MVVKNTAAEVATGGAQDRDGEPSAPEQQGRVRDQGVISESHPTSPDKPGKPLTPAAYYAAVLRIQTKFDALMVALQRKIDDERNS